MGELKVGDKIKANWNGAISKVVKIEKGIVTYDCLSHKRKHLEAGYDKSDGLFRDTLDVIQKDFTLV